MGSTVDTVIYLLTMPLWTAVSPLLIDTFRRIAAIFHPSAWCAKPKK